MMGVMRLVHTRDQLLGATQPKAGENSITPEPGNEAPSPCTPLTELFADKANIAFAAQEKCLKLSYHRAGEEVWI